MENELGTFGLNVRVQVSNDKLKSFLSKQHSFIFSSLLAGDKNFSFGKFFNERLENLSSFLPNKYPVKCQNPRALINDPSLSLNSQDGRNKSEINFEKVEAKNTKKHDSKDSGTASDNSCVLSLSAIDRALGKQLVGFFCFHF